MDIIKELLREALKCGRDKEYFESIEIMKKLYPTEDIYVYFTVIPDLTDDYYNSRNIKIYGKPDCDQVKSIQVLSIIKYKQKVREKRLKDILENGKI